MHISAVTDWLKNTILGTILLGALGSVLALFILKVMRWVAQKLGLFALKRFLIFQVRPFVQAGLLASRYAKSGDNHRLTMLFTFVVVSFAITCLLFIVFLFATIVDLAALGAHPRGLAVLLVTITGLLLVFLVRDIFALAGVSAFVFHSDFKEITKLTKNRDFVVAAFEHLVKTATGEALSDQPVKLTTSPPEPPCPSGERA